MSSTGEFQRMLESWKLGRENFFFQGILLRQEELEADLWSRAGLWKVGWIHGVWPVCVERTMGASKFLKVWKLIFFSLFYLICFRYKSCLYSQECHFQCVSSRVGKLLGARNTNCERGRRNGSIHSCLSANLPVLLVVEVKWLFSKI